MTSQFILICRFFFFACLIVLSGCLKNVSPFSQVPHYHISGIEDDQDTRNYLEQIIDDRTAEGIDYKEGSQDFSRAETAREEAMINDLQKGLMAKGYYDAQVHYSDDDQNSLQGTYEVVSGAMYKIGSIHIEPESLKDQFDFKDLKKGDVLAALPVLNAQNRLYNALQKDHCYFSLDVQHHVILDEATKTATLTYIIDTGPEATFGETVFEGQETVKDDFLKKLIPWKTGECFHQNKLTTLQSNLLETGLFVRTDAVLPETPNKDGSVPIAIQLKERVHKSVKAGVSYYTDEGAGIQLGWENRNVFGRGEKLQTDLNLTNINQSLDLNIIKPFFLRKDQGLEFNSALRRQNTDAYEESAFDVGTNLKRTFNKRLSGNTGVQLSLSEIQDENDRTTYGLLSFPNSLIFDNRDNPLSSTKGWLLKTSIEPFSDLLGESDPFVKLEAGARTYIKFTTDGDVVLAVRGNVGSIVGGITADIPATERFYAGGGASVRGFGYQEVGPFENGNPSGGRSVVTGSTELRLKLTDTLGGVVFVDGGSVSDAAKPDLDNLSFGTGLGVRYYTDFGPLRFDIGIPINQTDHLDKNYQFYISIGQAF